MTGFYMIQVFSEKYFRTNFSLLKHDIHLMYIVL